MTRLFSLVPMVPMVCAALFLAAVAAPATADPLTNENCETEWDSSDASDTCTATLFLALQAGVSKQCTIEATCPNDAGTNESPLVTTSYDNVKKH